MPENEGPGQVLFYEWKCVARGLASEPYLGNVIGGTIEFETSGWADHEPRFWHIDGRGARCATGKLGYPADASMKMPAKAAAQLMKAFRTEDVEVSAKKFLRQYAQGHMRMRGDASLVQNFMNVVRRLGSAGEARLHEKLHRRHQCLSYHTQATPGRAST
jgi:hypothetical protein